MPTPKKLSLNTPYSLDKFRITKSGVVSTKVETYNPTNTFPGNVTAKPGTFPGNVIAKPGTSIIETPNIHKIPDGIKIINPNPTILVLPAIEDRGLTNNKLTVPISPSSSISDELIYEDPKNPEKKYYLPKYKLSTHYVSGKQQFKISLKQSPTNAGGELTLYLDKYPTTSLETQAPNLLEIPHKVQIFLAYEYEASNVGKIKQELHFQEITLQSNGLRASLLLHDLLQLTQVYQALTNISYKAKLLVQRELQVAVLSHDQNLKTDSPKESVQFRHLVSINNTSSPATILEHPLINKKSHLLLWASQIYGIYNPHEIGVWYNQGTWKILNKNRQPIHKGCQFDILATNPNTIPYAFRHTANPTNITRNYTTINHAYADNNPNALVYVAQLYGSKNLSQIGVWYYHNKWHIYNENKQNMPQGSQFNVLILQKGPVNLFDSFSAHSFQHTITPENKIGFNHSKHVSYFDNSYTNGQSNRKLFATQRFLKTYNPHHIGLWYDPKVKKWSVFNQNKQEIPAGVQLNVLAI